MTRHVQSGQEAKAACVLQKITSLAVSMEDLEALLGELLQELHALITHPVGHQVVNTLLECASMEQVTAIVSGALKGQVRCSGLCKRET